MNKRKFSLKDIPGWVITLAIIGILYITGYHTEVIGQAQRVVLATGLIKPSLPHQAEGEKASLTEKNMAGAGFQMTDLNGTPVNFENLHGKVIFLNIWATWCPPCIAEMPNIQSLYKKVDPEKIVFVMLSIDEKGSEKVNRFIERKGYTFPVYLPANPLPAAFASNVVPATFIISPKGQVVAKHEGMANYDSKEMKDFLNGLTEN
ncbi:TlpA disulfide reductase family protein [Cytophagaceae bacterium ABcell3]|nr:TlpA disulfide reductase family protein [Cytophagaceae bacterium ABcell3]